MYDAIIVGMGPAGSSAALTLARAGKKVLAVDSQKFPRYKSCGGFLSRKIEGLLPFDISSVVEKTIKSAALTYRSGKSIEFLSDDIIGYNVMRDRFDSLLLDKAVEAGAEVIENCRITGISNDADCVTARSSDGRSYTANFLIAANGAGGFIGSSIFKTDNKEADLTLTAEVAADPAEITELFGDRIIIDFGCVPAGYAWIFPKKKSLSIGIGAYAGAVRGAKLKKHFNRFSATHPALKGREIGRITGWSLPIHYKNIPQPAKGRILLAGDAGHVVDPFIGEGIYYAILSAQAGARAIVDCLNSGTVDLSRYSNYLKDSVYRDFEYAGRLADLVFAYPKFWFSMANKYPSVMHRYLDVIRGRETYESFHNWVYSRIKNKPLSMLKKIAGRFGI